MSPTLRLGPCPTRILATAAAFPAAPQTNDALLARLAPDLPPARRAALLAHLGTDPGVATRAHLPPGADPLSLAVEAARLALARAATPTAAFAALILATSTASRWTTAESARLAHALSLDLALCDLRSGCTGGLWALVEGARLARDAAAPVLVVAIDTFSRAFPPAERLLPFAMGDGAAALVLAPAPADDTATTPVGLVRAVFGAAPALVDLATVTARLPPVEPPEPFVLSGDPAPFSAAAESALIAALDALSPPPDALVVPHVSRLPTAHRLAAHAAPRAVFTDGFVAHGSLGAASLLVALDLLHQRSPSTPDRAHHVVLTSAGGGLSYGAALWRLAPASTA